MIAYDLQHDRSPLVLPDMYPLPLLSICYNEHMISALLGWWYGEGWALQWRRVGERMRLTAQFFSLQLLANTLFQPYRQLSVGTVKGPANVIIRAFFDRLISRMIGFMLRMVVIVAGLIIITILAVLGILWSLVWPLLPAGPLIGVVLAIMRVGV